MPAAGNNWGGRQAPPSEAGSDVGTDLDDSLFGTSGDPSLCTALLCLYEVCKPCNATLAQPGFRKQIECVCGTAGFHGRNHGHVQRGVVAGSAPASYFIPPPARADAAIAPLVAAAAMDVSPAKAPFGDAAK